MIKATPSLTPSRSTNPPLDWSEKAKPNHDSVWWDDKVSQEPYESMPMVPPCGHSIAVKVVKYWQDKGQIQAECPTCSGLFKFSTLVPNYDLKEAVDSMKRVVVSKEMNPELSDQDKVVYLTNALIINTGKLADAEKGIAGQTALIQEKMSENLKQAAEIQKKAEEIHEKETIIRKKDEEIKDYKTKTAQLESVIKYLEENKETPKKNDKSEAKMKKNIKELKKLKIQYEKSEEARQYSFERVVRIAVEEQVQEELDKKLNYMLQNND